MNKLGFSLCAIAVLATSLGTTVAASAASQTNVLYGFGSAPDGNFPASDLVVDHAGNLYGTTYQGGKYNYGSVFELVP